MTSFFSPEELSLLGFKRYGDKVLISRKASFYGAEHISIGDNVRIDDFCILSGHITLGSHIHISAYAALYGSHGIELEDYSGVSPRGTIFSAMDDFSGDFLIGPIHNKRLTNVAGGKVVLRRYSQVGAGALVFPNVEIKEGAVIGAFSLANKSTEPWSVYAGIPAKKIKERKKGLLDLVEK